MEINKFSNTRHKQAVQVLNKVEYDSDGNPIGMIEDQENILSCNFGTDRLPRRAGCYKFINSVADKITVPISIINNLCNEDFSLSFWIKRTGIETNTYFIDSRKPYNSIGIQCYFVNPSRLSINIVGNNWSAGGNISPAGDIFTLDSVHHILFTYSYSLGVWSSYIDGIISNNDLPRTQGSSILSTSTELRLNTIAQSDNAIYTPNINIWDIRFFNKYLIASEAKYLYENKIISGIKAHYKCSENSGTICYDSSGNGNHGTITNAITVPPEENPNSIHQYQDIYSWENEVGYGTEYDFNEQLYNIVLESPIYLNNYSEIIIETWALSTTTNYDYNFSIGSASGSNILFSIPESAFILPGGRIIISYNSGLPSNSYHKFKFHIRSGLDVRLFINDMSTPKRTYSILPGDTLPVIHSINVGGYAAAANSLIGKMTKCSISLDGVETSYLRESNRSANPTLVLPRNESIQFPPFKDVIGNNLQHIGKVPGRTKFIESSCFQGNGSAYINCGTFTPTSNDYEISFRYKATKNIPTTAQYITGGISDKSQIVRNGANRLSLAINGHGTVNVGPIITDSKSHKYKFKLYSNTLQVYFDNILYGTYVLTARNTLTTGILYIGRVAWDGSTNFEDSITDFVYNNLDSSGNFVSNLIRLPLCEEITNPSNHIYHNVLANSKHAKLINGTVANNGIQDNFHYLQKGFNFQYYYYQAGTKVAVNLNIPTGVYSIHCKLLYEPASWNYIFDDRYGGTGNNGYLAAWQGSWGGGGTIKVNGGTNVGPNEKVIHDIWVTNRTLNPSIALQLGQGGGTNSFACKIFQFEIFDSNNNLVFGGKDLYTLLENTFNLTKYIVKTEQKIPVLLNSEYDVIGKKINVKTKQDGYSFLNSGCKLLNYDYPALKQADQEKFWYVNNSPKKIEFQNFLTENPIESRYYFGIGKLNLTGDNSNNSLILNDNTYDVNSITDITTYQKPLDSIKDKVERTIKKIFNRIKVT